MIKDQENSLFEKWSKKWPEFSRDGIVDEGMYLQSRTKILLLLKEVNSKDGSAVDLKNFLRNGAYNRKATWNNVTRWIYGIQNIDKSIHWRKLGESFLTTKMRHEMLSSIIVMNLKKTPGKHTSRTQELKDIANNDKEFLNQQFSIYYNDPESRPDLIICGGSITSVIFNSIVTIPNRKWQQTSRGVDYYEFDNKKYFIKFSHPEARVGDNLLYYGLIDTIREITNNSN